MPHSKPHIKKIRSIADPTFRMVYAQGLLRHLCISIDRPEVGPLKFHHPLSKVLDDYKALIEYTAELSYGKSADCPALDCQAHFYFDDSIGMWRCDRWQCKLSSGVRHSDYLAYMCYCKAGQKLLEGHPVTDNQLEFHLN